MQTAMTTARTKIDIHELQRRANALGPWRYDHSANGVVIKGDPVAAPIHGEFGKGRETLSFILKQFGAGRDLGKLRALDLGCLEGHYSDVLCEAGFGQVTCIELSAQNVERARFLLEDLRDYQNIRVIHGSVENEELLNSLGQFDLILFHGLLYHLVDPLTILSTIRKISAPDSFLLLSTQFKFPFAEIVSPSPLANVKIRSAQPDLDGVVRYEGTNSTYQSVATRLNLKAIHRVLDKLGYGGLYAYDTPLGSRYGFQINLIATHGKMECEQWNRSCEIPGVLFYSWNGDSLDGYSATQPRVRFVKGILYFAYRLAEWIGRSGERQTERQNIPEATRQSE